MNFFKEAETVLESLQKLEAALHNMEMRKERLIRQGAPHGTGTIDYSKPFTSTHDVNGSLNELIELTNLVSEINFTTQKIMEINGVLEQIEEEQKKILLMWYVKKFPKEYILHELHIESLSTLYNLRNKAVAEFSLRYFGASAMGIV